MPLNPHGIAIEKWKYSKEEKVTSWLEKTFGQADTKGRWYIDYDYDLITLCVDEDVYMTLILKFGDEILEQK